MNSTTDTETFNDEKWLLHRVKFAILLALQTPALLLSLLIFLFFMKNRTMVRAPHNRALLFLLLVNFMQLSMPLPLTTHFYALGYVSPASPIYCTWWTFFAYTLFDISEYLMATISVQRHMLVFNSHVLRVRWMRIVLHHLPLIFCVIYPILFSLFAILLYPCDGTQWDYTNNLCGFANCYLLFNKVLGTYDWVVDNGLPMVVNALANALLIVRVVRQKRQRQRPVTWKQQRRMTVQLFCISSLYLVAWLPSLTVGVVQILGYPTFLADIQTDYFLDLINIICLFLPWVCLGLFPELLTWIKTVFHLGAARNAVGTHGRTQLLTRGPLAQSKIDF